MDPGALVSTMDPSTQQYPQMHVGLARALVVEFAGAANVTASKVAANRRMDFMACLKFHGKLLKNLISLGSPIVFVDEGWRESTCGMDTFLSK